jgi:hypothetical protein
MCYRYSYKYVLTNMAIHSTNKASSAYMHATVREGGEHDGRNIIMQKPQVTGMRYLRMRNHGDRYEVS